MKFLATIFSTILHPTLLPTIGLFLLFNTDTYLNYVVPSELKNFILLLSVMTTIIIPSFIALLMVNRGMIESVQMKKQKERTLPYIFTLLFYLFMLYILSKVPTPALISKFVAGAALSVLVAFFINIKYKVSAHMIGISGLLTALIIVSVKLQSNLLIYIYLSIIATGILGVARLVLKAHTLLQLLLGIFVGISTQLIALYYLEPFL